MRLGAERVRRERPERCVCTCVGWWPGLEVVLQPVYTSVQKATQPHTLECTHLCHHPLHIQIRRQLAQHLRHLWRMRMGTFEF